MPTEKELRIALLTEKLETEQLRQAAIAENIRPSTRYRSYLYLDDEVWICVGGLEEEEVASELHGEEIICRVYGYGESPADALADFDRAWNTGDFEVRL